LHVQQDLWNVNTLSLGDRLEVSLVQR
jgi:hypothetical protein